MSINFGAMKKGKTVTETPIKPSKPHKPKTDWKKKYENQSKELEQVYENLRRFGEENSNLKARIDELEGPIADELDMHRQQEANLKKAVDELTMQLSKFQFDPVKFSQLAQVLTYLRVHGNKQALIRVKEIVGTTELSEVRKWIFDLLEAPYK